MADISDIVDVIITRDTLATVGLNLQTAMFISTENVISDPQREYSSLAQLQEDGFSTDGTTYKSLKSYFSQSPAPDSIFVGQKDYKSKVTLSATLADNVACGFKIKIGSATAVDITTTAASDASSKTGADLVAEKDRIFGELVKQLNALSDVAQITVVPYVAGDLELVILKSVTATEDFVTEDLTATCTRVDVRESWTDAITKLLGYKNNWYITFADTTDTAEMLEIAGVIETREDKFYFAESASADNLKTSGTGSADDILDKLSTAGYTRTSGSYYSNVEEASLSTAVVAKNISYIPGSTVYDTSILVLDGGADNLSETDISNIESKYGNYFTTLGGLNMYRTGRCASGDFVDIVQGTDRLRINIETAVFNFLASTNNSGSKVNYSAEGSALVRQVVEGELRNAVSEGFVLDSVEKVDDFGNTGTAPGFVVWSQPISSVSKADRANRIGPDIYFTATLAGAIGKQTIRGTLSV